jgi:arylsulfatase A-like enzyme
MRVLLISVPGLHIGYLGCYGNDWTDTAALDTVAAEGIVFDQHFADCLGQWPSLLTGQCRFPERQGCGPARTLRDLCAVSAIPCFHVAGADAGSLWERLDGVCTAISTEFERHSASSRWLGVAELPDLSPPWSLPEEALARFFAPSSDDDAEDDDEPPVPLADPPREVAADDAPSQEALRLTYAAAVWCVDQFIAEVLSYLEERKLLEELTLIVTSERGVALGEHSVAGEPLRGLHEEVAHVPLLMRLPGAREAGRRVNTFTQPVDLFPTVLDLLGIDAPAGHGRSLVPLLDGTAETVRDHAFSGWVSEEGRDWALRTTDWTLLLSDGGVAPRLFARPDDRWEVLDLLQGNVDLAEKLEKAVRDGVAKLRDGEPEHFPLRLPDLDSAEREDGEETT